MESSEILLISKICLSTVASKKVLTYHISSPLAEGIVAVLPALSAKPTKD